jgi:two-component system chemotaxis response regulator CheY
MKILIVEDNFTSRVVLQKLLAEYGECHIAVDGQEALEVFRTALDTNQPYDLICLDVMMPKLDGQKTLSQMRAIEEARKIESTDGATIIMVTALNDMKNVMTAYDSLCDGYLTKPISKASVTGVLQQLQLA